MFFHKPIFFNSQEFLFFFLGVFIVYWLLPWKRVRIWLLVAASINFYAEWSKELAFLVVGTTVMDYILARFMDASQSLVWRRVWLATSLTVNLGLLAYFKYMNFFLGSIEQALHAAGYSTSIPLMKIIVPFGISFYTFEAISYAIDVYMGRVKAEKYLSSFLLFILFFPHLVSGPIVRAKHFLPQTHARKKWSWLRLELGFRFFLMGLIKKVIADRMALFSDPIFAVTATGSAISYDATAYNTGAVWLAVFAYAIRIYCDFSGYSDMAVGAAHMLGYKLTFNFNMPYLATSPTEFWRRWHISLSTWFRDYVYIPLGGSRAGEWVTNRNLFITFFLSGLWHGAAWTFVAWGALHGLWLCLDRAFRKLYKFSPRLEWALATPPGYVLCWSVTFLGVMFLWVLFRAHDFTGASIIFARMFTDCSGLGPPLHNRSLWYLVGIMVIAHYLGATGYWKTISLRMPGPALGFGYATAFIAALVLDPGGKPFIYFDF